MIISPQWHTFSTKEKLQILHDVRHLYKRYIVLLSIQIDKLQHAKRDYEKKADEVAKALLQLKAELLKINMEIDKLTEGL